MSSIARWSVPLALLLAVAAPAAAADPDSGVGPARGGVSRQGADDADRGWLTPYRVQTIKAGVAATACALLLLGVALRAADRSDVLRRTRAVLLGALGALGLLCGWNLLQFHHPHFVHRADVFHYFMGAKYFDELGYTRLYECSAVAVLHSAGPNATERKLRNLETNTVESTDAILADPARCTDHFTESRWQAFRRDVSWFRSRTDPVRWRRIQLDHGYNATPVWGILGTALADTGPASEQRILLLALLDPLLLGAAFLAVGMSFGWRSLCVALVFWGTSYYTEFGWNGGSFLRQGWLAASILGLCLLRRGRPLGAGIALGTAALLRLFPGMLVAGIALAALGDAVRRRRLDLAASRRRLVFGGLLACATLVPLSFVTSGGAAAWPAFVENSRVHLATPFVNHMGLRTLLSYDPDGVLRETRDDSKVDPFSPWHDARRRAFAPRRALFAALIATFSLALAWLTSGRDPERDDWVAGVLGVGLIPVVGELTGYYYSVLLAYAFLHERTPILGAALCGLAAASWAIAGQVQWRDEVYVWNSLAVLLFVLFATTVQAVSRRRATAPRP